MVRFPVPRRSLLDVSVAKPCTREAVPIGINPLTWLYAAGDEGLPQDGLPIPTLVTAGYEDNLLVYQWQGERCALL